MNEEELIKILEDYEIFVDDDYGGSYQSIIYYDKEKKISKAHTTISALKIIEIFNKLQQENKQLKQQLEQRDNIINKAREILEQYRHYTVPDEKQNKENENIVDMALEILNIDKGDE